MSSREENPKKELDLTSFRHFAHLWIAYLVRLTRNGINIIERKPNRRIDSIAIKYPRKLALYSTIE